MLYEGFIWPLEHFLRKTTILIHSWRFTITGLLPRLAPFYFIFLNISHESDDFFCSNITKLMRKKPLSLHPQCSAARTRTHMTLKRDRCNFLSMVSAFVRVH